ncbi:MAG: metal-sulfur cluster assembly factor, partial [Burkholderiaceae bacterium]
MNTPHTIAAVNSAAIPRVAAVWSLLEHVCDPEIPVLTLRDLGILREVREAEDGQLEVVITPTYSGCPAMDQIEDDVRAALAEHQINA